MNPEIKQQWVDALRSGKYTQAGGWLHTNKGFCCLGVLCDLAAKAGVVKVNVREYDEVSSVRTYSSVSSGDVDYSSTVLPNAVIEWAGVKDQFADDDLELASKNDSGRYNFNDIAKIIERRL